MKPVQRILLAHGSGGRLTHQLVRQSFLPALQNPYLERLSDAAVLPELPPGRPALTTDAFVVDPPVFPGGDLGYLSVCGTINDLAVAGARPQWLTWAVILEEGCETSLLETMVAGTARAAEEAGVRVVAGDTKVVPRGKGDHIYAVTAGLGVVPPGRDLGDHRILPGDAIVVSGALGDHGATIMALRHQLGGATLRSDCAPLGALAEAVLESGADVHAMHDPTRGGIAVTCNEVSGRTGLRLVLDESALPVRPEVRAVCDLLGLDPLYLASEGRILLWVARDDADRAVHALRADERGRDARVVGHVDQRQPGTAPVVVRTAAASERPLDFLSGLDLPRIC